MKIVDKAIGNYLAMPPMQRTHVKAAFTGIGMFFLYLGYEAFAAGWRKALGIFLAVTLFCLVTAIAAWLGNVFSSVLGSKIGNAIAVMVVFGFIGGVLYFIFANWG